MSINIEMQTEILLSIVNTKLRDFYPDLKELSLQEDVNIDLLKNKLKESGYEYNEENNQFLRVD